MRDPDLVQRAERAAIALERAWGHWRVMHGLGTDPLPPVSSYVGYSLEEPWGQPRVVFGVGAEEAERLAALLAGHDCYGPVHAEITARPDWRLAASGGTAAGQGRPLDSAVSIPAQAPPPGAEPVAAQDAWHVAAAESEADGNVIATDIDAAVTGDADEAGPKAAETEPTASQQVAGEQQLEPLPPMPATLSELADFRENNAGDTDPEQSGNDRPTAGSWQHGEPAGPAHLAAAEQPGVIAFPRRPEQPPGQQSVPFAAAPVSDSSAATPSQGPGYCGPRYQGFPPQYQPGPDPQEPPTRSDARRGDGDRPAGAEQSEAGESDAGKSDTGESDADRPAGAGQSDAGQYETEQSDARQYDAEEYDAGQPGAEQSEAEQSGAGLPGGGQPKAGRPGAPQSSGGLSGGGLSGGGQSGGGQSGGSQPKPRRSGGGRAGTSQSGADQAKVGQARAAHSSAGKSSASKSSTSKSSTSKSSTSQPSASRPQQTSGPGRPSRTAGRDADKRPPG